MDIYKEDEGRPEVWTVTLNITPGTPLFNAWLPEDKKDLTDGSIEVTFDVVSLMFALMTAVPEKFKSLNIGKTYEIMIGFMGQESKRDENEGENDARNGDTSSHPRAGDDNYPP